MLDKILLPIILITNSHISEGSLENTSKCNDCAVRLQRINISNDTILTNIIQEIISQNRDQPSSEQLYALTMNDYQEGTILEIVKMRNNILDDSRNWNGCLLENGCKIAIDKIDSEYVLTDYSPKEIESFRLGPICDDVITTYEEVWYYYILGDIYARFSPEAGWIWSDGKPDE